MTVNWEQVINEMGLSELRRLQRQIQAAIGPFDIVNGVDGWTRLPDAWSFFPPAGEPPAEPDEFEMRHIDITRLDNDML